MMVTLRIPKACRYCRQAIKFSPLRAGNWFHQLNVSKSTCATLDRTATVEAELHRLRRIRNVGVLAHVDAGKTTVTERMLALAGAVTRAGSVDLGNTVTDFLPAERERGITIQSAAVSFNWGREETDIHLIDTPGHIDFSVEVNRCVAVLDGAVLVVDAVAGVQAQTETVWRAMRGSTSTPSSTLSQHAHHHEPLPCFVFINKMDKEGCNFYDAVRSLSKKLKGANPVPIQLPLFWTDKSHQSNDAFSSSVLPFLENDESFHNSNNSGQFAGVVDLVHMRMVLWPEDTVNVSDVDECRPHIRNLVHSTSTSSESSSLDNLIRETAIQSRSNLIARLAEVDAEMEDLFLNEMEPSSAQIQAALRRATLRHAILPVLAGAALKGKGVEPVLDAISHYLPSPLDRMPPALISSYSPSLSATNKTKGKQQTQKKKLQNTATDENIRLGHPLHPSLLAMAFKVVHMKGRGGSGDGRVVFARVYSGKLKTKDTVRCITPSLFSPSISEDHSSSTNIKDTNNGGAKLRQERVGAMLELAGGRFDNLEDGVCKSGEVCALVGLKTVATGDTLMLASEVNNASDSLVFLAGVASPKPVLTIRLEAESSEQQGKLSKALQCLAIEDPSLRVEETGSATLLSGLGELHVEVTIDRLKRDFGLEGVTFGKPTVSYRETVLERIETNGLFKYDRTVGGTRLEASVHLIIEPVSNDLEDSDSMESSSSLCRAVPLQDPLVEIGPLARKFMNVDDFASEDALMYVSGVSRGLILGVKGALRRGAIGPFSMGNVKCTVVNVDAEGGLKSLEVLPGAIRAAAANAIAFLLSSSKDVVSVLEPVMTLEVTAPSKMVGPILSDLNARRGSIGEIVLGDETSSDPDQAKAVIRGDVPLAEILGYATALRSMTGGEGTFTAEYVGHATCGAPVSLF